jgi:CubicO group peptidase (beta-lactamase class C family)
MTIEASPRMAGFDGNVLHAVDRWGASTVAVAVVEAQGLVASRGPTERVLPWASVTKPLTAATVLVAVDRGLVELDEAAGPPGSTVRHLLAHASGFAPDQGVPISPPERTRIYSNAGFDLLAELVEARARRPFAELVSAWVTTPLHMTSTRLTGRASEGAEGSTTDLAAFARELLAPTVLPSRLVAEAIAVAFPNLRGVLPGFGLQDPNDWGLGVEIKGTKAPHWTGTRNSPGTFGHFGRSGTFLWVDPAAGVAVACLTDRAFGTWAADAWPRLSDRILSAYQPDEPGSPLMGPTIRDVTQPP